MRRIVTPEERVVMAARYTAGLNTYTIAASFGLNPSTVRRALLRDGIALRDAREAHVRHTVKHDVFDVLTPDAAYWCGFLFADGSVVTRAGERTPTVVLNLADSDRAHLEKYRAFLGSTHAITSVKSRIVASPTNGKTYIGRPQCRIAIRSSQIAGQLCALGRYEGPIDERLAQSRHFWRGVVDGDGHVGIHCGHGKVLLSGSLRVLSAYAGFVNVPGTRPLRVRWARTSYAVTAGWATARRIAELLYADAGTALDRKAEMAQQIIRLNGG